MWHKWISTRTTLQCTHILDVEMSEDGVGQCDGVDQSDLVVAIGSGARVGPILGALDLHLLHEVGEHDYGGAVVLPHHTPEVRHRTRQRTLGCYVLLGTVVTLWVACIRGDPDN